MFELSVACKYLLPRWRQLSVSIISIISILVISLVVWLIVVFFSVTNGLEQGWTQKLISLTAPIRITPTDAYYRSYYYQVDSISSASDYAHKSIAEKLTTPTANPYDPMADEEIPSHWPLADLDANGSVKDIVKQAFSSINELNNVPGLTAQDFEVTYTNMRLRLQRDFHTLGAGATGSSSQNHATMNNGVWLGSFDPANRSINKTVLPIRMEDLRNILNLLSISNENISEDAPGTSRGVDQKTLHKRLQEFFQNVTITQLKTPGSGWIVPKALLTTQGTLQVCAVMNGNEISRIVIPQKTERLKALCEKLENAGMKAYEGILKIDQSFALILPGKEPRTLSRTVPLILEGSTPINAEIIPESLATAYQPSKIKFRINFILQGTKIQGETALGNLEFGNAEIVNRFSEPAESRPQWLHYLENADRKSAIALLPANESLGEGVLLPRSFREAGVLLGDRGYFSYYTPTASSMQEQRIPIFVAGFYDPGIIPIGGKFVLANHELTSLMRASYQQEDPGMGTGINVRFDNLEQTDKVKAALQQAFKNAGIDKYWKIETYREFDFTKDIIQQLRSEKNLFMLIATVIIIVACSNIISMLIILVNDKKLEIGILRSMGASSASIAFIFGSCGMVMGFLGSILGTIAAIITLKNLQSLIGLISKLQGYEMFNAHMYGDVMPHELSYEALAFVLISTALISLLAGIVPAVKASLLKPSAILKSE